MAMAKKKKLFPLGDVLSIIIRGSDDEFLQRGKGASNLLKFMTRGGEAIFTLEGLKGECRIYLARQFQQLFTPDMSLEIAELDKSLKNVDGRTERRDVVEKWLTVQIGKYGQILEVESIPRSTTYPVILPSMWRSSRRDGNANC